MYLKSNRETRPLTKKEAVKLIRDALSSGRKILLEPEAKRVLSAWGIQVPRSFFLRKDEMVEAFKVPSSPPYVMKVVSYDILHKSDVGGVAVNIKDTNDVKTTCSRMITELGDTVPDAVIEGFLLEEMAPKGIEVIIGGFRDPQFGPVVTFGIGGILVEIMKDISYRLAPLNKKDALEMIREVKGYPLLAGFRGFKAVNLDILSATILRLANCVVDIKWIKEIEINPLIADEKRVTAVDAKIILLDRK